MYKSDFPIFTAQPGLVYLDTAATAQKPAAVIEAVSHFYTHDYATIHRGLYPLSIKSTEMYEAARSTVASFISATTPREIVFVRNATEALNLLATTLGEGLKEGDEILISDLEHHANLVPWQQLAKRKKLTLQFVKLTETGEIDQFDYRAKVSERTKIISLAHCSNVLGTVAPLASLAKIAKEQGSHAYFIADAAQSVPHFPVSVQELGCDFLVFSGHKVYGPSGIGVLWGREELLNNLPPYQTGGDMVLSVSQTDARWQELPSKFEAGTPNLEGALGLAAAIRYLQGIGLDQVAAHTTALMDHALNLFREIPEVTLLSEPDTRSGIISFTVHGMHPHDLAEMLAEQQVCIRAGHHCAMPLHSTLNISASNRISLGIYSTEEDLQAFFTALKSALNFFKTGHV